MAAFDSTNVETLSTASFTPPLLSPPRSVIEDDDGEAEGDNESGDEEERVVTDADERAQPQRQQQQGSTEEERLEKVTRNGMLYSKKKANLPYMKAHTWKEVEERKRQRQQQQQQQQSESRKEKEGSPPHLERTAEVSRSLLRYAVVLVLGTLLLSRMVTESWTFGYQGKWTNLNNWIPRQMQTFSEAELARYDGSDPSKPIYLGLDGDVYDVTAGARMYGRGASYNHFAGRDAARAFVTGCFQKHLTHDVRGLDDKQQKSLAGWKRFFSNHAKYYKIGSVVHDPIHPLSPLPEPCDPKAEGGAR